MRQMTNQMKNKIIDLLAYPIRHKKVEDSEKSDLLASNCAKPDTYLIKTFGNTGVRGMGGT